MDQNSMMERDIEYLEQDVRDINKVIDALNDRINRLNAAVIDLQKRLDYVEKNGVAVIDPSEKWR